MWSMERLYREVLPANWVLYQVMTFVDANTFDMYAKNMGQIMMEKITNADLLVFNRCTDELKAALRKRNLRMVNRRADIYLEDLERQQRGLQQRRSVPLRPESEGHRHSGQRLRRVVCGRDGLPRPLGGEDRPHEAADVPLQEVPRHPLPRPVCHGLLRKRRAVHGSGGQGHGSEQVQEPGLGGGGGPHGAWKTTPPTRARDR